MTSHFSSRMITGQNLSNGTAKINPDLRAFFSLRKRVFVDELKWDVPNRNGMEYDQYDHELALYCLLYDHDELIGGSRILPTMCQKNGWSYMIRDAALGRLNPIPPSIIETPPQDQNIYEVTRYTIDPKLSKLHKLKALKILARANSDALSQMGAHSAIALMHPGFAALFQKVGLYVKQLGPVIDQCDGKYVVLGGLVPASNSRAA